MKLSKVILFLILALPSAPLSAQGTGVLPQAALPTWGDQGNGTYVNPILNADYSDPDVIRHGDKYYMIASDFHFIGMQVLESDDMVNWTLISQVYDRFDFPEYDTNQRYAGGSWAPALRYHDGKFWIYFCSPDEGLFMTTATDPAGPWEPLHLVCKIEKWEDPCPLWDDDGQTYLGRSRHRAGPIIVHRMSADGRELLDDGVTVYTGPVAEGTKFYKLNGYYYLSIPEGGVGEGWQTVLRSKNIYGPYEKRVVLEQGCTAINGPHQGAMVDTPDGEWWFYHFQKADPLGRVVHLQPMYWKDGWPVIGVDTDRNGVGEPVTVWTKPHTGKQVAPAAPQTDDDFSADGLALQWQWNHNPAEGGWSLTEKKGALTLTALPAENFLAARNVLTQRTMGYQGTATVKMTVSALADGQRSGLACMGKQNVLIGLMKQDGRAVLYVERDGVIERTVAYSGKTVSLRMSANATDNVYSLYYSSDGKTFKQVTDGFPMRFGNWKGVRVGLYCYNVEGSGGKACFDDFVYEHDGPQ